MRIHVESLPLPPSLTHSERPPSPAISPIQHAIYLVSISYVVLKSLTHLKPTLWIKMTSTPITSPSYSRYPSIITSLQRLPQRADLEDQEQPAFASTTQENTSTQHQQNRRPKTLPLAWNEKERIKLPHATAHPIPFLLFSSLALPSFSLLCFAFLPAVKVPK